MLRGRCGSALSRYFGRAFGPGALHRVAGSQSNTWASTVAGAADKGHCLSPAPLANTQRPFALAEPSAYPAEAVSRLSRGFSFAAGDSFAYASIDGDSVVDSHTPATDAVSVYAIEVITGDFRGAGTTDEVTVRLYGESGFSEEHLLAEPDAKPGVQQEFKRGSRRIFKVATPHIGRLRRVQVALRLAYRDHIHADNWFLDKLRVICPDGKMMIFPFGDWLGDSGDGELSGSMQCDLIPQEEIMSHKVRVREQPLQLAASAFVIPNPDSWTVEKRAGKGVMRRNFGHGGEDAYFIASEPNMKNIVGMGVSDGVYMWRLQGIDAGLFSQQLMQSAAETINTGASDAPKVLQVAAQSVKEKGLMGSATVCIVTIDAARGLLKCTNLGDSGFLILRYFPQSEEWQMMYKSPQQEHHFGCPYQLGHQATSNYPEEAMLITRTVEAGDLVMLGSDGLFDNLFDTEIVTTVEEAWNKLTCKQRHTTIGARAVAQAVANRAFFNSLDKHRETPYSRGATEEFDMVYSGGKADDITVVAGIIS